MKKHDGKQGMKDFRESSSVRDFSSEPKKVLTKSSDGELFGETLETGPPVSPLCEASRYRTFADTRVIHKLVCYISVDLY